MHTLRSFLAFAAMAQLASPLAQARPLPRQLPVLRHPEAVLQLHPGRDVHFHNDLATGQLTILDLRHAVGPAPGAPQADILHGARRAAGGRDAHDFYLYALTRQAAFDKAADLERYMAWYGGAGGLVLPTCARQDVELLRLRFGACKAGG
jgi:hypothetical protein